MTDYSIITDTGQQVGTITTDARGVTVAAVRGGGR